MGCPVDTCTEEVAVTFLRGDDVVGTTVLNHTQKIHKLNLVVDEKTAGTYACKVDINGATLIQQFNVTGTYMLYSLRSVHTEVCRTSSFATTKVACCG